MRPRKVFPVQMNPGDLDLFDAEHQGIGSNAVAHSIVIDSHDDEDKEERSEYEPCDCTTGISAKEQAQHGAGKEDDSSRNPIFVAD